MKFNEFLSSKRSNSNHSPIGLSLRPTTQKLSQMLHLSITPNKTALYHRQSHDFISTRINLPRVQVANNQRKVNELSKSAQKRIKNAVNWMTYLSSSRNVSEKSGISIKNFQISFVTLTLPTKQMHTHDEIKSKCLNHFLTVLRQKFKIQNYIWKAELQRNGNIHFHLTFDKFIHYMALRNVWNSAISKLGYIREYAEIYKNMDFDEYHYWRSQNGSENLEKNRKAFDYGVSTDWLSPNTTDVKQVKNVKNLASYLSKYLGKSPADPNSTGIVADSLEELTGRLWFCSQSISKLNAVQVPLTVQNRAILRLLNSLKHVRKLEFDWSTLFWYNLKKFPPRLANWFREALVSYAIKQNYPFPSGFPT